MFLGVPTGIQTNKLVSQNADAVRECRQKASLISLKLVGKNNHIQTEPSDYEVYIEQEGKSSLEGPKDQTEAMKGVLLALQYFS